MKRQWWHNKTAYQIYPKSFYDSNGDGIGDLPGIIEKLDYLKYLGVDILWLSPIYQSPLADQGYDISDYYQIDPRFGTMEDMDRLIKEAKSRGMYVLMDLVVNHCSDEHEWFKKAMADPEGEYGNFFYLADQKDGRPCNWRSYFGGSVWDPLPGTDKQYLHMFHKKQPDLNWENPKVRQEIYKNIRWWLDKGLSGFRIDAIINIKKALPMQDYPADRADGLCAPDVMLSHAEGIGEFLKEMRDETFRKYDAFTVGEVFNEKPGELEKFIGNDGYFSSMFDFNEHLIGQDPRGSWAAKDVTAEEYKEACFMAQEKVGDVGFYSTLIENHDEARGVSRFLAAAQAGKCGRAADGQCGQGGQDGQGAASQDAAGQCGQEGQDGQGAVKQAEAPAVINSTAKKMLAGLYFMLRGLPFIYQGQEIGMENVHFTSIDEVDDISTRFEYQTAMEAGLSPEDALAAVGRSSRDNARTPMQWEDAPHAGFTAGEPWLKENPNYHEINVKAQMGRKDSVLEFYRSLIALRKDEQYQETVVYGALEPYRREQKNLMAYFRKGQGQTLLVLGNFQEEGQLVRLSGKVKAVLLNNLESWEEENGSLWLQGWQFAVLEME